MTESEILKPFEREERYIVTKIKTGKRVNCVVIEYDWPEYEPVWEMLQDRMEGRPNQLERDAATIAELQTINQTNAEVETLQNKRIKQLEYDIETWNIRIIERLNEEIAALRNESAQTRIMKDSPFTTGYNNNLSERVSELEAIIAQQKEEIEALSNLQKRNNEEVKIIIAQKDEEIERLKNALFDAKSKHSGERIKLNCELSATQAREAILVDRICKLQVILRGLDDYKQADMLGPLISNSTEHTEKFLAEVRAKTVEWVKSKQAGGWVTVEELDEMANELRGVK